MALQIYKNLTWFTASILPATRQSLARVTIIPSAVVQKVIAKLDREWWRITNIDINNVN